MSVVNQISPVEGNPAPDEPAFLKISQVVRCTGLGRSTIYAMSRSGEFPKQVELSRGRVGWPRHEIAAWQQSRIDARDGRGQA